MVMGDVAQVFKYVFGFLSGEEYCNLETFNVSCDAGEVILIEHALYGRMKKGRCVQNDLGTYNLRISCTFSCVPMAFRLVC